MKNNQKSKAMVMMSIALLVALISAVVLVGCKGKNILGVSNETEHKTDLKTKEENIAAYNKAKGYKVVMNSGVGFGIYVPQKDRENNRAFFHNLNKQSKLNGYDFSSYLDKPLQYVAMAIESNNTSKDISFLCYQEQIVGVWIDSSNQDHLTVRGELLKYNFVYDSAGELLKYKSAYIGDNSNMGNLMYSLPYVNGVKPIALQLDTDSEPYGVTIKCQGFGADKMESLPYFKNAAVIFSLIDNVGMVTFNIEGNNGMVPFTFTRMEIEDYFQKDVREYTKSQADFEGFLKQVLDSTI